MSESETRDEDGTGLTPLWERIAAVAAGGAGAAAASLVLGPEASLLAGPAAAEAMEASLERVRSLRSENATWMLEEAARCSSERDVEAVELLERLTADPARTQLFALALDAATRAIAATKLEVLGRALASGALAADDADLNLELLLVRAIADVEAPHLRVLDLLYPRQEEGRFWDSTRPVETRAKVFSPDHLRGNTRKARIFGWKGFPELGEGLDSVLATLRTHGLTEEGNGAHRGLDQGAREEHRQNAVRRAGSGRRQDHGAGVSTVRAVRGGWQNDHADNGSALTALRTTAAWHRT